MISKELQSHESIEKARIVAYRRLFGSPIGQKVLLDLCKKYSMLREIEPDDIHKGEHHIIFINGTQAPINRILRYINKNPMQLKQEMVETDGI